MKTENPFKKTFRIHSLELNPEDIQSYSGLRLSTFRVTTVVE